MRRERVAILGGGIAGLAAAWELSGEAEVTVYERDWRLGGKGASSRGEHGRIEEHGLHVWGGFYHNAFRTMREVYAARGTGELIASHDPVVVAASDRVMRLSDGLVER